MRSFFLLFCACSSAPLENPDAAATPDGDTDAGPCASIAFDALPSALPVSNTLRLAGTLVSRCDTEIQVTVRLDGADLAPFGIAPLTPEEASALALDDSGNGTWKLVTNLLCPQKASKVAITGDHDLEAVLVRTSDGEVLATQKVKAHFSPVVSPSPDVPWVPGTPLPSGTEAGNAGASSVHREHSATVKLNGGDRTFAYAVDIFPGYDPKTPAPVVIALTGWGSDDWYKTFAQGTGIVTEATTRKWLVVTPNGNYYDPTKSGSSCSNPPCVGNYGCLDHQCEIREKKNWYTPVFSALMKDFALRYSMDTTKVYVTGFSCGGSYAYCLGMAYPSQIAASVVMDGNPNPAAQYPPYGAYVPQDLTRETPLYIIGAAAGYAWWAYLGPKGKTTVPWCLSPTYEDAPGTDHQWYSAKNGDIFTFFASKTLTP